MILYVPYANKMLIFPFFLDISPAFSVFSSKDMNYWNKMNLGDLLLLFLLFRETFKVHYNLTRFLCLQRFIPLRFIFQDRHVIIERHQVEDCFILIILRHKLIFPHLSIYAGKID